MAEIDASPILSSFRILGLHGYKNVTLDFAGPARIVIAEMAWEKPPFFPRSRLFSQRILVNFNIYLSNQLNVISLLSINLWYFIEMSSRILLIQAQTKDSGNCLNSLKLIRWNSSTRFLKVISIILPKSWRIQFCSRSTINHHCQRNSYWSTSTRFNPQYCKHDPKN